MLGEPSLLRSLLKDQDGLYKQWNEISCEQKEQIVSACIIKFQITESENRVEFDGKEVEKIRQKYLAQKICFTGESSPDVVRMNDKEITASENGNVTTCCMPYIYKRYRIGCRSLPLCSCLAGYVIRP